MVGHKPQGSSSNSTNPNRTANEETTAQLGPSDCGSTHGRVADASAAMREMAAMVKSMDPSVVRGMLKAREAAEGIGRAFPGGDQRFVDSDDSEYEQGDEKEVEMDDDDSHTDACQGLFDEIMHKSPLDCLQDTTAKYDFDLVKEMDSAGLDFFQRIRFVNFIRKVVKEGQKPTEAITNVKSVLERNDATVLENEQYLVPVLPGDVLLTALESEFVEEDREKVDDALEQTLREEHILKDT